MHFVIFPKENEKKGKNRNGRIEMKKTLQFLRTDSRECKVYLLTDFIKIILLNDLTFKVFCK